ncbi:GNAT family N-acetyltransferase [Paenibacillus ginsengarvi]|uniref:GNAT family N-acetyltransferase n=1 Tax=Paenibacillus ginsengarvi TaxID=400777 RepID=A0A3B0CHQ4_9BACL|nr:GNAT family N-acetyltransferase [Paenibacillus ginsengarvi]RKN85245.1 GNAT family N-acetyltransferase [Paenibacillus ginsengarvi]
MEDIRLVRPEEHAAAAKLADLVFRDADHKSMGDAYPNAFSPSLSQSYGVFVDGDIVSFVGFVPAVIRIGEAELNVYSIGAVCTHPDYRGKGYISIILDRIREHALKAEAPVILVSGSRSLYLRFGCRVFGDATSFVIDRQAADKLTGEAQLAGAKLRPMAETDWFRLKRLAEKREVRYEMSVWDIASLIHAAPTASNGKLDHRVWVAERDGQAEAFAVISVPGAVKPKGSPALIEWAGDPALAAALIAHGATEGGVESIRAVVPRQEAAFAETLRQAGCASSEGKLSGTAAVIDSRMLLKQLAPYLNSVYSGAYGKLRFDMAGPDTYIVEADGRVLELSCDSFVKLVFDRGGAEEAAGGETPDSLRTLFPIPFPYTAGLNYV